MGNESSTSKDVTQLEKIPENHGNGSVKGISVGITSKELDTDANIDVDGQKNGGPPLANPSTESTDMGYVVIGTDCQTVDAPVIPEALEVVVPKEEVKKVPLFNKMFKKKTEPPMEVKKEPETSNEDQTDVSVPASDPELDTASQKQASQSLAEPQSETVEPEPRAESAPDTTHPPVDQQEESILEENPVMNFFKTLVTPTKTTKKETDAPAAAKDQSQKEKQPSATTTVAQVSEPPAAPRGMSVPPPPPPEPPKIEVKAELAARPSKPTPKDEPKAAAKEPESSRAKSAKDTLNKFFRPKVTAVDWSAPGVDVQSEKPTAAHEAAEEADQPIVEEQLTEEQHPEQEEEKVDPSKTGTLEAAPKPEPPPPVPEEKKTPSKSAFLSLFKPKAADPSKPAPPPAPAAEAAPTPKAKEEPKAAAKSPEVVAVHKTDSAVPQAGEDAGPAPKQLEKKNSVKKFFQALGQRRSSTDAGVQTDPAAVGPAATEKTK
ncbi:breast carcinoma-amplified sequence 1 isoform X2 [Antennarius striatus]|uniref:breast carcinoma-amplified sequence 1 isoform X2 n=1 Tax=Antennarius striatus TaxID=241820 RepID=UPI0035B25889